MINPGIFARIFIFYYCNTYNYVEFHAADMV